MTGETAASLRALARRCRRLAKGISGNDVGTTLASMADDYDRQAERAEAEAEPEPEPPHLVST